MHALPRAARSYLIGVVGAGVAVFAFRLWTSPLHYEPAFFILLALVAVLGSRTVALGHRAEMALSLPLILCALLALGPAGSVDVAVAGMLSTCLLRGKPFPPHRTFFNVASIAIATAASGLVYYAMGGRPATGFTPASGLVPLIVATLTYYAANTSLVAMMIALAGRRRFAGVWKGSFRWTLVSYLAGASIAAGMVNLLGLYGPYALALAVPPILLIYYSYRAYADRAAERRKRMEEIEQHNAHLESEVARRTQELRDLNEQLSHSNDELTRVNQLKSEFLANMSHELRTPLNAIIGFSELLEEKSFGPLTKDQGEFVQDIYAAGRHLLELINDILDLSKIEAGRMALHTEECDLGALLRETLTVTKPLALKKDLRLEIAMAAGVGLVHADPGKLKQIMYNLLSNAVKFTDEGGTIRVETRAEGETLVISVLDSGIGIPDSDLGRIFDEFYQVDGSYTRKHEGTGLGLALVKRLVEMHGGAIEVESRVGRGSAFRFRIPGALRETEEAPAAETGLRPRAERLVPGAEHRGVVLVVEDNPTNMRLTRSILSSQGYEVLEAPTGEEALRVVRSRRPDLILMDLQLPGLDGLTLTRMIQGDPATHGIPTVALTACVMAGDEERARSAGCVGYISKPVSATELPVQVAEYMAVKVL